MRLASALTLLIFVASSAAAQTILTGRVTDRSAGIPIAGVVVSGLDSAGQVVSRGVTDLTNGYRLALTPTVRRIQFRRIGYSPFEAPIADTASGRLDATLAALPRQLPPVRAMRLAQCEQRDDTERALALWEEARAGLLASIVARQSKSAWISILLYQFRLDGERELPRAVERIELASASNAFSAGGDPQYLADNGYTQPNGVGFAFLAPDDVVLADETFLATHCFSVADSPRGDDSTLGLKFEPSKDRRVVEVEGTLWLRKEPLELKSVDYRYVNVDKAIERARAGGSITFHRMPNGISMIQSWRIRGASTPSFMQNNRGPVTIGRAPAGGRVVGGNQGARSGGRPAPNAPAVRSTNIVAVANETGAMIELMQWPGAAAFVADLATVTGVVRDRDTGRPIPNHVVTFSRSPYRVATDSTGAFRLVDVLPGTYQVDTDDPVLDLYGASGPIAMPREIKRGRNDLGKLDAETPQTLVKRNCKDDIIGMVRAPKGLGNAALFGLITGEGRGTRGFRAEVRLANMVAGSEPLLLKGTSDPFGRFRICGIPAQSTVTIVTDETRTTGGRGEVVFDGGVAYKLLTVEMVPRSPTR